MDHFEIPLDYEPFVSIKRSSKIGVDVIASFGFVKTIHGQWVNKRDHPQPIRDERTPSPPPQDTSFAAREYLVVVKGLGFESYMCPLCII